MVRFRTFTWFEYGNGEGEKRGEQDWGGKKGKKVEKAEKARRPATKQQCIGTEAEACFQ